MTTPHLQTGFPPQRASAGFVASSVLFAIALLVALGAASVTIARGNGKARQFQETREQMVAQRDLIFSALLLCRTIYPSGNNGTIFRKPYPAAETAVLVSSLVCPGQSPASIWSNDLSAMVPRPLPGFGAWTYVNDATSLRIATTAVNAGLQFNQDLLDAVVKKIGSSQAVRSGDTLTITFVN